MIPPLDVSTLPQIARKALDPASPAKMRQGAARGLLPGLKPEDVVIVVAVLAESPDQDLASTASNTLATLPKPVIDGALAEALPPSVVDTLAREFRGSDAILGRLLGNQNIEADTVVHLAETGSEMLCERIATNEERLLKHPAIIERLYLNKATRMSTADRVLELAVRNDIELEIPAFKEAAAAIKDELISAPSEEPTPDDLLFAEMEALTEQLEFDAAQEDTHEIDDEGKEVVKDACKPIWVQISQMTISQKIRRAILGSAPERMLLVRDSNRLVASAAIRSPLVKEHEVAMISASRSISEDVLRIIALNREWTRHHQIKHNLVTNPRTPFTFAVKLITHLREHELKMIAKSKNVPGAIATAAKQHLFRKGKKS